MSPREVVCASVVPVSHCKGSNNFDITNNFFKKVTKKVKIFSSLPLSVNDQPGKTPQDLIENPFLPGLWIVQIHILCPCPLDVPLVEEIVGIPFKAERLERPVADLAILPVCILKDDNEVSLDMPFRCFKGVLNVDVVLADVNVHRQLLLQEEKMLLCPPVPFLRSQPCRMLWTCQCRWW